ncbi:hypothetical protein PILCRDRAFT_616234 [Piloderma croceum F 1598]|uniref:Uncharacterized protein n=1 Tax=Piloderma croceum (strain F 1598) TaxID=765440 RepID=A0A0C3AU60_PILCF|nr:hypothetical protein PILCRDRAFT_616234 [Piloderma croceum F 1598]
MYGFVIFTIIFPVVALLRVLIKHIRDEQPRITDDLLKFTIRELWASHPETKTLGTAKLHMLLRVRHTDWQIAEKRFRRIRQELLDEQAHGGEDDASDTPPEFKGFNKHKTYDLKRGQVATIYTAPGAPGPQHISGTAVGPLQSFTVLYIVLPL